MFVLMFLLLALGVPIGVCLMLPLFVLISLNPVTNATYLVNCLYSGVASYSMIALPFFILAGAIMDVGGLSKRLVNVADALIGRITGSLGMVAILGCMFFGAVSGSAPATCAAIGTIMLPQMVRAGYDKYYSVGLIACAGSLGVIVPPSYPMVIYGITTGSSIGTLFISGLGPALLVGITLMAINYVYCKKHNIRGNKKFSWHTLFKSVIEGLPALLMPIIILGGIYSGVFTATEAAVVSCVYGMIVGFFIYRKLSLKQVLIMLRDNAVFIGGTMLTIAPSTAMAQVFAYLGVANSISNLFLSISTSKYFILLVVYIILFIAGMFVQTTPCIVILTPILLPVCQSVGIDVFQFGMIMVLALSIAFVTPPVASNLFIVSTMTGIPMNKYLKPMMPFMIGLFFCLILVGVFPQISTCFVSLFSN